jgi:Immunoglobulin domain/Bacterial Ig-like domain
MRSVSLKHLLTASLLGLALWLGPAQSARATQLVGLIDFNSNNGGFTVVSTNIGDSALPWTYQSGLGTWNTHDQAACATAFRASRLNSPVLTVVTPGTLTLTFAHRYSFEDDGSTRWDGGQLRLSVNGGPYAMVPLSSFSANGYNNTVGGGAVPNDELAGQEAFTGTSTDYALNTFLTSTVTLGTFNVDDTVSIQFLAAWDDCSEASEPNWEIDSVQFSPALENRVTPPSIADPTLPADATVVQGTSHTLEVVAAGAPVPTIQWYHNGLEIPGATASTYTIADMTELDGGVYFARATNPGGMIDSRMANITYQADTFPPAFVSAVRLPDGSFLLSFSEPLDEATQGFDTFNAAVFPTGGDPATEDLVVASGTIQNQTNVVVTTSLAPTPGVSYDLALEDNVVYDIHLNGYDNGQPAGVLQVLPIQQDLTPPEFVSGRLLQDGTVLLTFNEDLDPASYDTFNTAVYPATGSPSTDDIGVASATVSSNTVVLTLSAAPAVGVNYNVGFLSVTVSDIYGNPYQTGLPVGEFRTFSLDTEVTIFAIDDQQIWKWNQDGVELGSPSANPFYLPSFNDNTWGEGPALLGFDTTPQNIPEPFRTTLTPTASGGPNTTYFRTRFVLSVDPSAVRSLSMRTVVDDSCVIYLNGVEVLRVGIDPTVDPITFDTQGRTVGDAAYEGPFDIPTGSLVAGENVLACELKQHDQTSSDLVWGCDLKAVVTQVEIAAPDILTQPAPATQTVDEGDSVSYSVVATGTPAPGYQWQHDSGSGFVNVPNATSAIFTIGSVHPTGAGTYRVIVSNSEGSVTSDTVTLNVNADLTAPTIVSLLGLLGQTNITIEFSEPISQASATDLSHYSVQLRAGGGAVTILSATLSADGKTVTLTTDARSSDNYSVTVMGIQDLSSAMNTIATVTSDLPAQMVLNGFSYTGLWKYNQEFFTDPPADWFMPNFDDSTWPEGPGILGEEVNLLPGGSTVLALGVPPIMTDLNNTSTEGGPNTIYFRKKFTVDNPVGEVQELRLNYLYDDGFVAYLNGAEVIRHGVAAGQTYDTAATSHESDVIETSVLTGFVQGENTIAVEMHQQSATGSSDIVWGSEMVITLSSVTPQVRITNASIDGSGNVILEFNGTGLYVQETSDLAVPFVTRAGGPHTSPYNAGPATGIRFFRLSDTP